MNIAAILVRRLSQGVVIVLLTTLIIFTLLRVVPGDPVRLIVGGMAPDTVVEEVAKKMGLRDPILVQFGRYVAGLAVGDLGHSYQRPKSGAIAQGGVYNDPTRGEMAKVSDLILERLRRFRESGIGDPDEKAAPAAGFPAAVGNSSASAVAAARELLAEARALRTAVS